jgi:hypothetical protein
VKFLVHNSPNLFLPWLGDVSKHRISANVGSVHDFLSTRLHAVRKERRFALVDELAYNQPKARS